MKSCSVAIQVKPGEQHFPVVPFIKLYELVLTFEPLDKILSVNLQTTESSISSTFQSRCLLHLQSGFKFLSLWGILHIDHSEHYTWHCNVLSCCKYF